MIPVLTVEEKNKLIHHFVGGKWQPIEEGYSGGQRRIINKLFDTESACQKFCDKENKIHVGEHFKNKPFLSRPASKGFDVSLHYNSSFEWLMPVVEKIEGMGYYVTIDGNSCKIGKRGEWEDTSTADTKIEAVYKQCVIFIKWWYS